MSAIRCTITLLASASMMWVCITTTNTSLNRIDAFTSSSAIHIPINKRHASSSSSINSNSISKMEERRNIWNNIRTNTSISYQSNSQQSPSSIPGTRCTYRLQQGLVTNLSHMALFSSSSSSDCNDTQRIQDCTHWPTTMSPYQIDSEYIVSIHH